MDVSTPESAAGDAPRCGQSKCAKVSRAFHLECEQFAQFGIRNLPRLITKLSKPKPPKEMGWRLGNDLKRLKRITLRIFALLRNHHRSASFQTSDLPVDMQHLRFKKCRAITSDNRACLGRCTQRARLDAQRSASSSQERPKRWNIPVSVLSREEARDVRLETDAQQHKTEMFHFAQT